MSIEDRYLSGLIAVQYPDATDPTSMDGVQLAAGPSNTVSDAGGGVRVGRAGVPYKPPSMSDITEPAGAMLDMGAATLKGATQGFIGLPGDLEGIGRLVLDKMGFGVDQNTVLPKTEEVKKWLDSNVGQVGNGQNPYEAIGEVTAPGGQVKALKAAGRGAKALAPKAAEMVIDATAKTGMPVRGLGIVSPEQAMTTNVKPNLPTDPVFSEAVSNTPGAEMTKDGLLMNVVRFQKPEQEGDAAIRTGVFYLPQGAATAKHYKTGKTGYGGTEKFEGQTLIKNPLFVKGATGGKAPEAAYDKLNGKKAYEEMRDEVLKSYGYNSNEGQKIEAVQALLVKYNGIDETDAYDQAYMIVRNSKTGNTLPYAVQENIVAHAVRNAGYDAVVGYSKGKAGASISEVFDVREQTFPANGMDSQIHDSFMQSHKEADVRGLGIVENAPQLAIERVPGVKPGDELIVQHNLTASNLLKADKLGGLPVPSLAISKVGAPLEGFGEITLIAPKEMATPSAKNPVFASDAYTKRFPTIDYQIDFKGQKALKTLLGDVANKIPSGDYEVDRLLQNWNDRKYSDILKAKFLDERGELPNQADFQESWKFNSEVRTLVDKHGAEFQDWLENFDNTLPENGVNVKERIFKGFTYSGNRRYAEVNLTNLVKEMKGGANEEGWNYGVSSLRAAATPKFKKFAEIKDARDKIIDSKSMESVKDQTRQAYESLLDRLFKVNPQYDASDAMLEVVQTKNINSLDREYDLPPELKADIGLFIQKLKTLPTEYFEMKPQRAVNLDEFKGAIIPKDTPQAARDVLKKAGITDIHEYSTPEERKGLFDKFGKEMFATMPAAPMGAATMQDKEKN